MYRYAWLDFIEILCEFALTLVIVPFGVGSVLVWSILVVLTGSAQGAAFWFVLFCALLPALFYLGFVLIFLKPWQCDRGELKLFMGTPIPYSFVVGLVMGAVAFGIKIGVPCLV